MRTCGRKVVSCICVAFAFSMIRVMMEFVAMTQRDPDTGMPRERYEHKIELVVSNHTTFPSLSKYPVHITDLLSVILDRNSVRYGCFGLRRPNEQHIPRKNGYWQTSRRGTKEIFAISAYYDDRPFNGLLPSLRILAVSAGIKGQLYCYVWYDNYERPYITYANVTSSGRGDKFSGIKYEQSLYSCNLPIAMPTPTHVTVVSNLCQEPSMYLAIEVPIRAKWQREFGVCVAIAFGKIPAAAFVEWMELNKMLGITEFNIYDGNISSEMDEVFRYYSQNDELRVFAMPPPVNDFSKRGVKLGSPASLNDCMLRNMYRYRYIVVIDFDEFIIPRRHDNYTALLRAIDKAEKLTHPWLSYTFRNVYHFDHFPQDKSQPIFLKTMRFRHHIKPSGYLYAPKSFIDPRQCLSVFNHYCYKRGTKEKRFTIDVNTTLAASHHFRSCGFDQKKCSELSVNKTVDNSVLRFKKTLEARVKDVLEDIKVR